MISKKKWRKNNLKLLKEKYSIKKTRMRNEKKNINR